MRHVSPPPVWSTIVSVLTRDTLVLLYLAVAVTEALIYSLPMLDPGTLTAFGASPFQIPFVATAAMAGFYGLGRIENDEERLFWRILACACVFWLATLVAIALVPAAHWRLIDDVWVDAAYLFFYSPILFAAECKPHLAGVGPRRDVERQLRWAGVTLLVVGWFLYFVVAPVGDGPVAVRHDAAVVAAVHHDRRGHRHPVRVAGVLGRVDPLAGALRHHRPRGRVAAADRRARRARGAGVVRAARRRDDRPALGHPAVLPAAGVPSARGRPAHGRSTARRANGRPIGPRSRARRELPGRQRVQLPARALHPARLAAVQSSACGVSAQHRGGRARRARRAGGGRVPLPRTPARGGRAPAHRARGTRAARADPRSRQPGGRRRGRRVRRHAQEPGCLRRSRHRQPGARRSAARRRGADPPSTCTAPRSSRTACGRSAGSSAGAPSWSTSVRPSRTSCRNCAGRSDRWCGSKTSRRRRRAPP